MKVFPSTRLQYHNIGEYPDPQTWLSDFWRTGRFGERIEYSNPALDALLDRADATLDPAERLALYVQAEDILFDDVPMIPLHHNLHTCLVKPRVGGIVLTPEDTWCGATEPLGIRVGP